MGLKAAHNNKIQENFSMVNPENCHHQYIQLMCISTFNKVFYYNNQLWNINIKLITEACKLCAKMLGPLHFTTFAHEYEMNIVEHLLDLWFWIGR